ncbi:hypothetical protein KP509_14G095300 [Ceratopteris richardii]|uniref:Uncharacterized protein n=1 Tax=Ceratopteris richardii TaxID=49495 RepID=A0A8T2TC69_CERRI|nr:hypothetical protein KP509_14G095300 [Ceratopteris richardii]KAH7416520.1 hypothetical protein KP509_14G095300 [Ceratopteris richardii]
MVPRVADVFSTSSTIVRNSVHDGLASAYASAFIALPHTYCNRPPRFSPTHFQSIKRSSAIRVRSCFQDNSPPSLRVKEFSGPSLPEDSELGGELREEKKTQLSQGTLIWRAIKLPIYSVALVPLSVGSAAAFYQTHIFHAEKFAILLGSAVLVIAWLNLSNDAYDAETGVDRGKQESVVNIVGSKQGVLVSAYACLILGVCGLLWVAWQTQNIQMFVLQAAAIACGYVYQCPPFRLSYFGLGEPLCFFAFGPLSTLAFYLSQQTYRSLPVNGTIMGAATLVGITTTLILFCSHFHQIEGDRSVGKLSPLVRLGTEKGKEVVRLSVIGVYLLAFGLATLKFLPYPCAVFIGMTLPLGKLIIDYVMENHENKEKIFFAKYFCVRLHAAVGAALSLGFILAAQITL